MIILFILIIAIMFRLIILDDPGTPGSSGEY
jgi:hypothetical protein